MNPLCFVLMPFGPKTDSNNKEINFDIVYDTFIKPAIIKAGLEPIRADEEKTGGFIHKPMYERLMFCRFAVADLSFANANVFYELGIRHALRSFTTISIFEQNTKLPFDAAPLRTMPYQYDNAVVDVDKQITALSEKLKIGKQDSPIGQMIMDYQFPDLDKLKAASDSFAAEFTAVKDKRDEINDLVKQWKSTKESDTKRKAVDDIVKLEKAEEKLAFKYDLLFSFIEAYKSTGAFKEITVMLQSLVDDTYKDNVFIKQQLGLAYNKIKERDEAEEVLTSITDKYGPDPETNGLLGAVYKGLMDDNSNDTDLAAAYRTKAIDAYLEGFETDPRDYYPGINALTLLYFANEPDNRFAKFLPVVAYAVERELRTKGKDYWAQATALELAALALNEAGAKKYLANALTCKPEEWMKQTTAGNLKKIYNKALQTNDEQSLQWLKDITLKLDPKIFN
ncbi:MAG: TRAFs-binding domain-containing protein [Bacteroidota bacterium]